MALPRVVIGVDSSTQATKALAVDVDTGAVLGAGRAPHAVSSGRESDPRGWWSALVTALVSTGRSGHALAVSVAGQQHGLVTLDADGEPVRPALLWNDTRSAADAAELVAAFGAEALAGRVGSVPTASFTIAKWLWLRRSEPSSVARAAAVRLPHDYLTERLCGVAVTERGDASGTGWWTPGGYDAELLGYAGLDPGLLPRVVPPGEQAGVVTTDVTPLPQGALVAAGTGDNMAAAIGLGLAAGQPVVSLGTSGTVYAVTRTRPADPSGVVAGFADALGGWLPLACTLNCTLAVDRIAALLGLDREAVAPGGNAVVLPFLDGERTPNLPYASGLFHGLRHETTPGQLLQAAYDGAAYSLLTALDQVLAGEAASRPDAPLLLIGGGARGTAWRQTIRRLSGRPLVVPRAAELVALGAAAQAAALVTGEAADEVARRWGTQAGEELPALPRDEQALERIGATLDRAADLLGGPDR